MAEGTVRFVIRRQDTPQARGRWEQFEIRLRSGLNVISALMDIAADSVDRFGNRTTPIAYESNCLEEVCGSWRC